MNIQLSDTKEYINRKFSGALGQVLIRYVYVVTFFLLRASSQLLGCFFACLLLLACSSNITGDNMTKRKNQYANECY